MDDIMKCTMKDLDEMPQMKDMFERINNAFRMEKELLIIGFLKERELLIKGYRMEKELLGKEFMMEKESAFQKVTENFNKEICKYKVYIFIIILFFLTVIGVIYYKYIYVINKVDEYCVLGEK